MILSLPVHYLFIQAIGWAITIYRECWMWGCAAMPLSLPHGQQKWSLRIACARSRCTNTVRAVHSQLVAYLM